MAAFALILPCIAISYTAYGIFNPTNMNKFKLYPAVMQVIVAMFRYNELQNAFNTVLT